MSRARFSPNTATCRRQPSCSSCNACGRGTRPDRSWHWASVRDWCSRPHFSTDGTWSLRAPMAQKNPLLRAFDAFLLRLWDATETLMLVPGEDPKDLGNHLFLNRK